MNFLSMDAASMVNAIETVWNIVTSWWIWITCLMLYVWFAVALWRIAKRRRIEKHWLALIPVGNLWILGSIADRYRSQLGQNKNRRKALKIIGIAAVVLTVVLVVVAVCGAVDTINRAPSVKVPTEQLQQMENMTKDEQSKLLMELMIKSISSDKELVEYVQGCAVVVAVAAACLLGVTLAGMVICRIAAYDVLRSCDPYMAVFMTVLCCVFPPALPVAIFLLHRKDMGLPAPQGKKKK